MAPSTVGPQHTFSFPESVVPAGVRSSYGQEDPEMDFMLLIADAAGELPRADVGVEEMGKFARELADLGC